MTLTRRAAIIAGGMACVVGCSSPSGAGGGLQEDDFSAEVGKTFQRQLKLTGEQARRWRTASGAVVGLEMSADGVLHGRPTRPVTESLLVEALGPSGESLGMWPVTIRVTRGKGSTSDVVAVGTSLTAGVDSIAPWTSQWEGLTGFAATNLGWVGRDSLAIARRYGAAPYALGQSIEMAGVRSARLSVTSELAPDTAPAKLGSVHGTLAGPTAAQNTQQGTFTPTSASATSLPAGTHLWRTPDLADFESHTLILEASRNDSLATTSSEQLIDNHRRLIKRFTGARPNPRVVVAGQPLATFDDPRAAQERLARNAALQHAFPRQYADPWAYLRSDACASALGITWTAQDRKDIAAGVTPRQLRADELHPNALAQTALARFYAATLRSRGWL